MINVKLIEVIAGLIQNSDNYDKKDFEEKILRSVLVEASKRISNSDLRRHLVDYLNSNYANNEAIFDEGETQQLIAHIESLPPSNDINVPTKEGYAHKCWLCHEKVISSNFLTGSRRSKDKYKATENKRPRTIKPRHRECAQARKQCQKMYHEIEERKPKKRSETGYFPSYNIPQGYRLERIPGDGNCMYTAIARAMESHTGQPVSQQDIRNIIHDNLQTVFNIIQVESNSDYRVFLLQQLATLIGFDVNTIETIINDRTLTQSAIPGSAGYFEQQFGNVALISLLALTHHIPFRVMRNNSSTDSPFPYGITQWIEHAPNLLYTVINANGFDIAHLGDNFRNLYQEGNSEAINAYLSNIRDAEPDSYLIHYPATERTYGHFDLALRNHGWAQQPMAQPMAQQEEIEPDENDDPEESEDEYYDASDEFQPVWQPTELDPHPQFLPDNRGLFNILLKK